MTKARRSGIVHVPLDDAGFATTEAQRTRKDCAAMDGGITNITAAAPDLSRYRAHIAHLGLAAEREAEVLLAVWRMMGNFVDRDFNDDPVQHVHEIRSVGETQRGLVLASDETDNIDDESLSRAFTSPAAGRRRKGRS